MPEKTPFSKLSPVIIQVVPALNSGGVEQGVIDINAAIVAAGGKSIVVSSGGSRVHEVEKAGGKHIALPVHSKNPFIIAANIARLRKVIRDEKAGIVHVCSRAPAWSAAQAVKGTQAHYITGCHAAHAISGKLKQFYNSSIAGGEKIIAVSDFLADYLVNNYGVKRENIRVIHRGIPMGDFDPARVDKQAVADMAKRWGIPEGKPVILLAGRISRTKGQKLLLDALKTVDRDWYCVLLGSDKGNENFRQTLEAYIKESGFEGRVLFTTERNMPAAYMLSSVVVAPSITPEGFGRVPVEAQAMGKPVITADHGGTRETILPGETGWLTPPGDAAALSAALTHALGLDAAALAAMAQRTRAHVEQRFTLEKMCQDTLDVYGEVLTGNR